MKSEATLTGARLRELLDYDEDTGVFTWRVSRGGSNAGGAAGSRNPCTGYMQVCIDYGDHLLHRLAWFYVYGVWPSDQTDHRDGDRSNNRIDNLREATHAQNGQNRVGLAKHNTSGFVGVGWHKQKRRWRAYIMVDRQSRHLGLFDTAEQASTAYLAAKAELHEFQPVPRGAA